MHRLLHPGVKSHWIFTKIRAHFTCLRVERDDNMRDVVWVSRWNDVNAFPITCTELAYRGFFRRGGYIKVLR